MYEGLTLIETIDNQSIMATMRKISEFQALVQGTLKKGHDYDVIPGTDKPTLKKPGAEKIAMLFGINPVYDFFECIEDYKNEFFSYNIKCTLFKNGNAVAQGVGSCNSKEKKYRWVNVKEEEIPQGVDKSSLVSMKDKYGRVKYKVDNPDICSLVNTILKMAKKRAFVDATLQVAALSEIFTQDVEDLQGFIQKEQSDNMTVEEAASMKVNFGKHKGKSLGEIYKNHNDYVKWYLENGTDQIVKKAFEMLENAAKQHKEDKKNKAQKSSSNEKVDFETGEILSETDFSGTPFENPMGPEMDDVFDNEPGMYPEDED